MAGSASARDGVELDELRSAWVMERLLRCPTCASPQRNEHVASRTSCCAQIPAPVPPDMGNARGCDPCWKRAENSLARLYEEYSISVHLPCLASIVAPHIMVRYESQPCRLEHGSRK